MRCPFLHPSRRSADPARDLLALLWGLFIAGSISCFLLAAHRIAAALKLGARVEVYEELSDAFTDEEREQLVHKIKIHALYL